VVSSQPTPEHVRLKYGAAPVFAQASTGSPQVGELAPGDPITVLGAEGDFYQVQLAEGTRGFVYWHNLDGSNMPLTASERTQAALVAAAANEPPAGWRGILHRLLRLRR
jgi:hypothetical protein